MTPFPTRAIPATLLVAATAIATATLAGRAAAQGTMPPHHPAASAAPAATPSAPVVPTVSAVAPASAVAKARADSLKYPYTDADVHFMSAMIGHHSQAIVMARMAPTHGASPSVQNLAERIINAQKDEITTMQSWLRDRGKPVPEARPGPMRMMMNGMEHEMLMPGMLTEPQMAELDAARGPQFDRLFLRYMIQHHTGATSMVRDLFGTEGAGQDETVFKFASDVNVDQTTEIARMQRMLVALLFASPSAPSTP